jgi:hypothetical protein
MAKTSANMVPVTELRPTQMTIGFHEVTVKRKKWREADADEKAKLLRAHVVPAVLGPKDCYYIIDHHHFAKALLDEGEKALPIFVAAELDHLEKSEFWAFMDNKSWCHAYDANGERCQLSAIPKGFEDLQDDPYRSLVAELLRAGGCAKTDAPFFEFLWADFLRRRLDRKLIEKDPAAALTTALALAKGEEADQLPGWAGART